MAANRRLDVLTVEELRSLLNEPVGPSISIFHPTSKVVVRPQENSLRLKSLLPSVKQQLEQIGAPEGDACELMRPINGLLEDREFWSTQLEGLAMFSTAAGFRRYRLPFEVDELALVTELPYVKPLLHGLYPEGHFYVLALSQGAIRLLRAGRLGIEEVDLDRLDIPRSLDEALRYDDLQKTNVKGHPTGPGRGARGERAGLQHGFHGHGDAAEGHKSQIRRFFEAVDGGISKLLSSEISPVVIAAVDYLQPIYREVSHYPHILNEGIPGNPDRARDDELQERAIPIVERAQASQMTNLRERHGALKMTGLASIDIESILRAAHEGRVEVLFVTRADEQWGSYSWPDDEVVLSEERAVGDAGLYELAARQTILQGGVVHTLDRAVMPSGAAIAAIYRY